MYDFFIRKQKGRAEGEGKTSRFLLSPHLKRDPCREISLLSEMETKGAQLSVNRALAGWERERELDACSNFSTL